MRLINSLLAMIMLMAAAIGLHGQSPEKKGIVIDKIIAKVDNYIVLRSELEMAYQNYLSEGNPDSEKMRCSLLSRLVYNKLILAKAEIDSVVVSDSEVDANTTYRMNAIIQSSGNSPELMERAFGKTLDQIRLELRDQVKEQMLVQEMSSKITKEISILPSEVKRFYNKIPADSIPYYSSDVEVAQIVKIAKISDQQKKEAKQKLLDLRNRLISGEDWHELAKKYSDDPSARDNGGEMKFVGRGAMVPQYEAMAFKLRKGEISMPFESSFGFHIVQLLERRGNEYNSRHILISATPSEADVEKAKFFLDSLKRQIQSGAIAFNIAARKYSDDAKTRERGGYITGPEGGNRLSTRDLDVGIYFVIDTMKVGNISKPLVYRTDEGKEAARIVYFAKKVPPHKANLVDDWDRLQAAALAEKKNKALEKWFKKSKNDVYVKIDPDYEACKILE